VQYASNWSAYEELRYVTSGVDDLISRGNGPVQLDDRASAYFDTTSRRFGDWQLTFGGYLSAGRAGLQHSPAAHDLLAPDRDPDAAARPAAVLLRRLVAVGGQRQPVGSYRGKRLDYDLRADWIPAPRHELRVKWQWIGIDAEPRAAYRTDPAGNLFVAPDPVAPFTVNNLGLQIRYRYEIGPLSELFLVHARRVRSATRRRARRRGAVRAHVRRAGRGSVHDQDALPAVGLRHARPRLTPGVSLC
jgi:hypothetical protein